MSTVDLFGHMTGYWLYLKTLEAMGERAAIEIAARPPDFANCGWIWAFIIEAGVTGGTQLASSIPDALGITGRIGNLVSSVIGVYVLMLWGISYTGAVMNPAASLAATIVSGRFAKKQTTSLFVLSKVVLIYISAPICGASVAGVVEGAIERDRLRREAAREKFE